MNLYPFRKTVTASPPPSFETGVENIDIGGPAMIRAAAKNMAHVAVVVDPSDYAELLTHLGAVATGGSEAAAGFAAFRKKLAWKAFQVSGTGVEERGRGAGCTRGAGNGCVRRGGEGNEG